jgi:tRNA pseudouridine55 synthase
MATGLLVLGIGQGTRLLTHLVGLDKTYRATIRLGRATTTDDREGEMLGEQVDATGLEDARIERALTALRGEIAQVPSTVSAIKIDGKRSYARARAGEEVQLAPRPVRIGRFELTARREDEGHLDLDAVIDCSSGTYVRALARDLGDALGVGGHTGQRIRSAGEPLPAPSPHPAHAAEGEGPTPVAALDGDGRLVAVVGREGAAWRPLLVVPEDARC